jgi:transcriptional regulator with XRE-family HTH domain
LAAFIAETIKLRRITDRALLGRAGVSAHTLRNLRKGVPISGKSLFQLVRAAEQLRHETESVAAVNERWLQKARELLTLAGSQNKLAMVLGVSRPYLARVLSGEKPVMAKMIGRVRAIRILADCAR